MVIKVVGWTIMVLVIVVLAVALVAYFGPTETTFGPVVP